MNTPVNIPLARVVDRLAELHQRRSDIDLETEQCKQLLIAAGVPVVHGSFHTATVSEVPGRTLIDWAAVARHYRPSVRRVAAHTRVGAPYHSVRVFART